MGELLLGELYAAELCKRKRSGGQLVVGRKSEGWFIVHGESLLCFHFLVLWRICNLLSLPYWISCFNKFTYASLIFTLKIPFLVSWKIEFFFPSPLCCVHFLSSVRSEAHLLHLWKLIFSFQCLLIVAITHIISVSVL